jgi:hypothetical protein
LTLWLCRRLASEGRTGTGTTYEHCGRRRANLRRRSSGHTDVAALRVDLERAAVAPTITGYGHGAMLPSTAQLGAQ